MMDETIRTHTISRKAQEFVKETNDQDPYFGAKPLADVLIRTSNDVRYLGHFLAFDEEIIAQLGKLPGMSYCPDKKNKRGIKVFSANGCNHVEMTDVATKGYYFWFSFYRGKIRHKPSQISVYGVGFDMVCRAIFSLGMRWKGHWLGMDSWYTSIPLVLQLSFRGSNAIRTLNPKRNGLGKKF